MRLEDLPADVQAQVRAQVDAEQERAPRRRRSQKHATAGTTTRWRCAVGPCREEFKALAAMERHVDAHDGGGRYEVVL